MLKLNFKKIFYFLVFQSLFSLIFILPSFADGFVIPTIKDRILPINEAPNFSIKYHRVNVKIKDQYAQTSVDQAFFNETNRMLEGVYVFPVSQTAAISNFSMSSNGKEIKGEIYTKEEARKIYDDIVRQRKDPALLEYIEGGFFKASIFPLSPKTDVNVKLKYDDLIKPENNLYKYVYSLSTEKFSNKPIDEVVLYAKIKTSSPLKSIYSPTHNIKVTRISENEATVSYEEKSTKPNREFVLYYSVSDKDIGLNVLTYKDKDENKGYFMMMISPKFNISSQDIQAKDVIFTIDTSGSMSGEKIQQAKDALKFCINNLNTKDKFNIVNFSDSVDTFKKQILQSSKASKKEAVNYSEKLESSGGTNIDEALKTSTGFTNKSNKNSIILFLTDGQPTVGITDTELILKNLKKYNKKNARIFVFGVGFDVNIQFLDKISQENHGYSEYVRPEESIETTVSSLFNKINNPILTDINLSISDVNTSNIFPKELSDLFKGSQILILGEYNNQGKAEVSIKGKVSGKDKEFKYPINFIDSDDNDFIPRLWASRKIGYLLDEIRLKGKTDELVNEVTRLSKKYGIMTEFTSFLAQEDVDISQPVSSFNKKVNDNLDTAQEDEKGSWAISQSRNASKLKTQAYQAPNSYYDKSGKEVTKVQAQIQNLGNKTFFQRKDTWIDAQFEQKNVMKIKLFSDAYFEISKKVKGINKSLSIGQNLSLNINGQNVEIGEKGQEKLSDKDRKALGI